MDWLEIKNDIIRILVFVFCLTLFPAAFGIRWSKTGDNTSAYYSMGFLVLLVIILWIFQTVTGKKDNFLFFGVIIGGGFAVSYQTTGSLFFALSFVAYGFIIMVLLYLYQRINNQRFELVSDSILTLARTLIVFPALIIYAAPYIFQLDTIPLIIAGSFVALVLYPILHRYMHPIPDNLLDETYAEEIVLPVSRNKAYDLCREAVRFLPYGKILDASQDSGILNISASDSVGRTSRVVVTLESTGQLITKVKLRGDNGFIDFQYRIPTGRNELFVKIIIRYLQEMTRTVPAGE
jgi:hypothetical protein